MRKTDIAYKVKNNPFSYKEIDNSSRTIRAIANTYNYYDIDNDVLRVGCSEKSINKRGAQTESIDKILYAKFHDLTKLPGKSIKEEETIVNGKYVLYTEAKLLYTQEGEDTLKQYQQGIINQHSIGFQYVNLEYVDNSDAKKWDSFLKDLINPEDAEKIGFGFNVKEIELFEWSAVAFGANKMTEFLGMKSKDKKENIKNLMSKFNALTTKLKRQDKINKHLFYLQMLQIEQSMKGLQQSMKELQQFNTTKKDEIVKRNVMRNLLI